jgi:hypothetical protein
MGRQIDMGRQVVVRQVFRQRARMSSSSDRLIMKRRRLNASVRRYLVEGLHFRLIDRLYAEWSAA